MKHIYMLAGAIVLEIMGTSLTKHFIMQNWDGTYWVMPLFLASSYYLLSKAVQKLSMSFAYAVWEGVGLLGAALTGYFLFHEQLYLHKMAAFLLILCGLVLLKQGTVQAERVVSKNE